jgi:hypothetical protein
MATTATEAAPAQEQQANGNGEQKTRHSEVGHKSLLKSDDLYQVNTPILPAHFRPRALDLIFRDSNLTGGRITSTSTSWTRACTRGSRRA